MIAQMTLIFTQPVPFVRGSATSKAAAQTVLNAASQNALVMDALREGPKTDEQIHAHVCAAVGLRYKDSSIRRARVWLEGHGYVRDTGMTAPGSSGRAMTLWEAAR